MRVRTVVMVVVIAVLGAAACGSSAAPSTAPTTSTGVSFTGSNGSSFCNLARQTASALAGVNISAASPADVKKDYEALGTALEKAQAVAPAAIKGDFEIYTSAFNSFMRALAAAKYKLTAKSSAALETATVKSAYTRIQQYLIQVCTPPTT